MNHKTEQLIARLAGKNPVKILFVCLGNICRSPAAEGILKDVVSSRGDSPRWVIDSAGTGGYHVGDLPDRRMRIHARRRGIELTHICRQVRESDFEEFDMIVAMDASNRANLQRLAPTVEAADKIVDMADFFTRYTHFDHVPDPYYDGDQGFENVLDLLDDACSTLYTRLTPDNH